MPVLKPYNDLITAGDLTRDDGQSGAVDVLNKIYHQLKALEKKPWFFPFFKNQNDDIKGAYLYGPVGRGKTMLMDLFYDALQTPRKKRIHFHQFMIDVHETLKSLPVSDSHKNRLETVADMLGKNIDVLCFDEFHVTDVADAMILKPLFTQFFKQDIVVVSTSNWSPETLYKDGLNRERFIPFIDLITEKMTVYDIGDGIDYRMEKLSQGQSWFSPLTKQTEKQFQTFFDDLIGKTKPAPFTLVIKGHTLYVPTAAGKVAFFNYDDLLDNPYGAEDFIALADQFSILFLDNLPIFTAEERDVVKRFMLLVDTFYDHGSKLIIRANAPSNKIYTQGKLTFEFERTASRLHEMASDDYLLHH